MLPYTPVLTLTDNRVTCPTLFRSLLQYIDKQWVARSTLTLDDVPNAFNETLIAELTATLDCAAQDPRVRVVVLAAQMPSFSAGADLNWMRALAGYSRAETLADACRTAPLMPSLNAMA